MKHLLLTAFISIALLGECAAQTSRDTSLTMSDGVTIDALYACPTGSLPPGGFPAVLFVHGFGGSKEDLRSQVEIYALSGYVATGYSVRGQGNSGGEFDFFNSARLRVDMESMIAFTKALPEVNVARVGVIGASQGGIHAWVAAANRMGVRTVVSIVANGRFDEDWTENNAMNFMFAQLISSTPVRVTQQLRDSVNAVIKSGDITYMKKLFKQYTTAPLEDSVTTSVLIYSSYFDFFFNPSSALRQFAHIPGAKRIMMYPAGHALPGDSATSVYAGDLAYRWLNYWLRDDTADQILMSPENAVVLFDAATNLPHAFAAADSALWLSAPVKLPARLTKQTLYLSGDSLVPTPPLAAGANDFSFIPQLGSIPAVFRSQPLQNDMIIAGAEGNANIFSQGSGTDYQINLLLFDVDPATGIMLPVTRGHFEFKDNKPDEINNVEIPLNAVVHTIRKGHLLEALIHGGVSATPNLTNDFGNLVLPPLQVSTNTLLTGGATLSQLSFYILDAPLTSAGDPIAVAETQTLSVYPNPASSQATIHFAGSTGAGHLELFDASGQRIAVVAESTAPFSRELPIDVSGLTPGGYYVALSGGGRKMTAAFRVVR